MKQTGYKEFGLTDDEFKEAIGVIENVWDVYGYERLVEYMREFPQKYPTNSSVVAYIAFILGAKYTVQYLDNFL